MKVWAGFMSFRIRCSHGVLCRWQTLGFIKDGEVLDQQNDYQLLKTDSEPWSQLTQISLTSMMSSNLCFTLFVSSIHIQTVLPSTRHYKTHRYLYFRLLAFRHDQYFHFLSYSVLSYRNAPTSHHNVFPFVFIYNLNISIAFIQVYHNLIGSYIKRSEVEIQESHHTLSAFINASFALALFRLYSILFSIDFYRQIQN